MGGCMRCGRCCTSFGVCVTPFDILRLSRATGLRPAEIAMVIDEPPERERLEPAILIDGKPSLVTLRWKSGSGRRCIFFSQAGCMAYENRPMLCRTYPFIVENGNLKDIGSRACPRLWVPEGRAGFISDFHQYEREVEQYREMAKEWNSRRGGTLSGFLEFALMRVEKTPAKQ